MTLRWREMDSNLWYHSTKAGNSEASRGSRVEDLAFVVDGTTRNEAGEFLSSSQIVAKLLGRGRGCGQSVRRTRQTRRYVQAAPLVAGSPRTVRQPWKKPSRIYRQEGPARPMSTPAIEDFAAIHA